MARKGKPAQSGERVLVGARLPASLHAEIKHLAIDQGITVRELLERALRQYLKNAPAS